MNDFDAANEAYYRRVEIMDAIRRQREYQEDLSRLVTEGEDVSLVSSLNELLPAHYKKWGEAGALVVDIALREIPPVKLSLMRRILTLGRAVNDFTWPENMFADTALIGKEEPDEPSSEEEGDESTNHPAEADDDELRELEAAVNDKSPQERLALAATMFAEARHTKLRRTSRLRPGHTVRFDRIGRIHTGYAELGHLAMPLNFTRPELNEAYNEGFVQKAEALGFPGITARHGFEILRRAPSKLRAIVIATNEEATKATAFTEHGALMTIHKEGRNWMLPTSPETIWERSRTRSLASPDALALVALRQTVVGRMKEQIVAGTQIFAERLQTKVE